MMTKGFFERARQHWQKWMHVLYPAHCVVCYRGLDCGNENFLCAPCENHIVWIDGPRCTQCGRGLPHAAHHQDGCEWCQSLKFCFRRCLAVAVYERELQKYLKTFKYNKNIYLRHFLSRKMIAVAEKTACLDNIDEMIPVPLHRSRYVERGFNQSLVLAESLGRHFKKSVRRNGLVRLSFQHVQAHLDKQGRHKNVACAFQVRHPSDMAHKRILLIDDIMTTGSTVNACARVLMEAKVRSVDVFVFARGR